MARDGVGKQEVFFLRSGADIMNDQRRAFLRFPVGNDANVAALGEALAGCAKGAESAVIVTLGTGVGGGVVLGGRLLTGYTGAASEAGHMVIADTPRLPRCVPAGGAAALNPSPAPRR